MNPNTKTVTVEYTSRTIISYSFALIVFIILGTFSLADVGPQSPLWIKVVKSLAAFPYIVILATIIYIIKECLDNLETCMDSISHTVVGLVVCIILYFSFGWMDYDSTYRQTLSKVVLIIGLAIYLFLYMNPEPQEEEIENVEED